jgi:hypothetical protein
VTLRSPQRDYQARASTRGARSCAVFVALVFVVLAQHARAQSSTAWRVGALRFQGCGALSEAQVRPLLDADLRGAGAGGASARTAIDVDVTCAGDAALSLSLPGRAGTPRVLEVGDVPARLRARLAALAIAELLLVATLREEAAAPTPTQAAEPAAVAAPPSDPAPDTAPAPVETAVERPSSAPLDAAEPTAREAPEARAAALGLPSRVGASVPAAPRGARGALARVSVGDAEARVALFAPIVRGSLRVFLSGGAALWGGEALLRLGPFSAGFHASAAPATNDPLGALRPSLLLGVAELAVAGVDARWLDLRLAVRASAGRAAVAGQPVAAVARGRRAGSPFAEGALVVSAAAVFGALAVGLDLALGYSAGLVALSDVREALTLSGATLALSLSLEVLP